MCYWVYKQIEIDRTLRFHTKKKALTKAVSTVLERTGCVYDMNEDTSTRGVKFQPHFTILSTPLPITAIIATQY